MRGLLRRGRHADSIIPTRFVAVGALVVLALTGAGVAVAQGFSSERSPSTTPSTVTRAAAVILADDHQAEDQSAETKALRAEFAASRAKLLRAASEEPPTEEEVLAEHANDLGFEEGLVISTAPVAGSSMLFPLTAPITSPFGYRLHPIDGAYKLHSGTDFGAPCGTPVAATKSGVVTSAGWNDGGYGNRVVISHGVIGGSAFETTYNHLSTIAVRVGQQVNAGDGIGRVGTTGASTGCHLHFEVRVNGAYTDPMPYLDGRASVAVVVPPADAPTPSPTASPSSSSTPTSTGTPTPTSTGTPSPSTTSTPTPTTTPTATTATPTPTSTAGEGGST